MKAGFLDTVWTAPSPAVGAEPACGSAQASDSPRPSDSPLPSGVRHTGSRRTASRWVKAAWPIAILLIIHRLVVVAFPAHRTTDDFSPVYRSLRAFLAGEPIYDQDYSLVVPHYLYNPGATLLLSPLGAIGHAGLARLLFVAANIGAVCLALALLCRLTGRRLSGPVFPVAIALALATEAVTNTVSFGNINGVLLLALTVFLWALVRAHNDRAHAAASRPWLGWVAGAVLGLAITVKPQFAPLVVLPICLLHWRPVLPAVGIPVALNAVAWPLVTDPDNFTGKLLPYLSQTRDFANSSLPGVAAYLGWPNWLTASLWAVFALLAVVGFVFLLRRRHTDVVSWALTSASLILLTVMFLSSLGQQYYSQWLFPLLFTAFLPRTVMVSTGALIGTALCLFPAGWATSLAPLWGRWAGTFIGTVGWALLLCAISGAALGWFAAERSQKPAVESRA